MKLLLFSDLHADRAAVNQLAISARAGGADLLIGAGDFGVMRRRVSDGLLGLAAVGKPLILVAGNNESPDELRAASAGLPECDVLHGTSVTWNGVTFFGMGGGTPETPFGEWSYDLSDSAAASLLRNCPPHAVLIVHSPPLGTVDRDSRGVSRGSAVVREAIVRTQPVLAVCGHIHASGGQTELIGSTTVVNAGPGGVWFELQLDR